MVSVYHRKIRVKDGSGVSKVVTSTQDKKEDKEHGKSQKNWKIWNCKRCWTKMIPKNKNNSPSNWALVNKPFPIDHERWEKLGRLLDGYHELSNRQMEKPKNTRDILLARYKRKSFLQRIVTGDEEWI